MPAQLLEEVLRFSSEPKFPRQKRLELEFRMLGLFINIDQTGKICGAMDGKPLPRFQFEVRAQAFDYFRISVGLDFKPDSIAFTPVVQLGTYRLQQITRLFFG